MRNLHPMKKLYLSWSIKLLKKNVFETSQMITWQIFNWFTLRLEWQVERAVGKPMDLVRPKLTTTVYFVGIWSALPFLFLYIYLHTFIRINFANIDDYELREPIFIVQQLAAVHTHTCTYFIACAMFTSLTNWQEIWIF